MKWVAVIAGAIAFTLAGLIFFAPLANPPSGGLPRDSHIAVPVLAPPVPSAAPAQSPIQRVTEAASSEDEWSVDDLPATVARRLRDAKDKRAFYDRALEIGGGGHLLMAREAAIQCIDVQSKGMVEVERGLATYIRQGDPQYAKRFDAYRSIFQGCDGFATRPITGDEWKKLESRIAVQQDVTGLSYRVPRWDEASHLQVVKQLREVIASDDPYLIKIAGFRLRAHEYGWADRMKWSREKQQKYFMEELVWDWALCDLGKECGPDSREGRFICGSRGYCDWTDYDEIAPKIFATQSGPPSRERKDEIVAAIRRRDWAKLGL